MRYCPCCKRSDLVDDDFNNNKRTSDGKQVWCRTCTTEYNRRWYEANKERHRAYVREHDKRPRKLKTCVHCKRSEPDVVFYIREEEGRYYYRSFCMECDAIYKKQFPKYSEESRKRKKKHDSERQKKDRRDPRKIAKIIIADCKTADRKKGSNNDLTIEFVKDLISRGCMYCGDTEIRIGLDRIDNNLGHTKDNVNPSCRRCNWLRRDMPYEAWMRLVPAVRQIAKEGLFGDWHAGPLKSRQFKDEQKSLFGSLAQEAEQQSFKLQDVTSSVTAPTMGPVPDPASTRVTVTG